MCVCRERKKRVGEIVCVWGGRRRWREGKGVSFSTFDNYDYHLPSSTFHKIYPEVLEGFLGFPLTATSLKL